MFQEILAENGTKFVVAAVVVLLGLLCLALVLWIVRGRPSSPFIRGGRNRTPRLAVLDAAAIDTRRRLVLVRRDDVEHLILIGGPTDVVVETRIASQASTAEPAETPVQTADRVAHIPQDAGSRLPETAPAARQTVADAAAVAGASPIGERRAVHQPAAAPDGVSAMGKVLYAGDEGAVRTVPARAHPQAVTAAQQTTPATATQQAQIGVQRSPERRAEDVLDQNRQRVLATQPGGPQALAIGGQQAQVTAGQSIQRPVATAALARPVAKPVANVADNPALVSEFEKFLEAEIAASPAGAARPAAQPTLAVAQTPDLARQGVPQGSALVGVQAANQGAGVTLTPGKTREETEAEMARLLGEIAANRKA
jgi:hypothetical protein